MNEFESHRLWEGLEHTPRFQEVLRTELRNLIMEKKYGEEFFSEYVRRSILSAHENEDGVVELPKTDMEWQNTLEREHEPLIPEVDEVYARLGTCQSVEELIKQAQSLQIELTPADIDQAKENTVIVLSDDKEE